MAAVYSEGMGRWRKCPVTSYLVISSIPLLPGAGIYYTMSIGLSGEVQEALQNLDIANEGQLIVPWSGIRFDESGQNVLAGGIITQLIDGSFVMVYPFESAASEVVYP